MAVIGAGATGRARPIDAPTCDVFSWPQLRRPRRCFMALNISKTLYLLRYCRLEPNLRFYYETMVITDTIFGMLQADVGLILRGKWECIVLYLERRQEIFWSYCSTVILNFVVSAMCKFYSNRRLKSEIRT